jgi:hypothetical protein
LGAEETELIAFRIGEHVPPFIARLPDVRWPGTGSPRPSKLGVLITASGIDVEVQPKHMPTTNPDHNETRRRAGAVLPCYELAPGMGAISAIACGALDVLREEAHAGLGLIDTE